MNKMLPSVPQPMRSRKISAPVSTKTPMIMVITLGVNPEIWVCFISVKRIGATHF